MKVIVVWCTCAVRNIDALKIKSLFILRVFLMTMYFRYLKRQGVSPGFPVFFQASHLENFLTIGTLFYTSNQLRSNLFSNARKNQTTFEAQDTRHHFYIL